MNNSKNKLETYLIIHAVKNNLKQKEKFKETKISGKLVKFSVERDVHVVSNIHYLTTAIQMIKNSTNNFKVSAHYYDTTVDISKLIQGTL